MNTPWTTDGDSSDWNMPTLEGARVCGAAPFFDADGDLMGFTVNAGWNDKDSERRQLIIDAVNAYKPDAATAQPPSLKDTIIELAAKDREATIHTVLAALEELNVIRAVTPLMAYDHRIIGAHAKARSQIAHEIGNFLLDNDVIEFAAKPDLIGGGTALAASVVVVMPVALQVPIEQEPAGQG